MHASIYVSEVRERWIYIYLFWNSLLVLAGAKLKFPLELRISQGKYELNSVVLHVVPVVWIPLEALILLSLYCRLWTCTNFIVFHLSIHPCTIGQQGDPSFLISCVPPALFLTLRCCLAAFSLKQTGSKNARFCLLLACSLVCRLSGERQCLPIYHFHGTRLHSRIFSLIFTWIFAVGGLSPC